MTLPNNFQQRLEREAGTKQELYQSLKAKADRKKTTSAKLADWLTEIFGTLTFLIVNVIVFTIWILINAEVIRGVEPFDPFPFNFLTMAVSLEAIFLAIIVLISQNRAGRIADWRQEVDLQVDVLTEAEITKLLEMVTALLNNSGIDMSHDDVLKDMLQPTNIEEIEEVLEKEISGTSGDETEDDESTDDEGADDEDNGGAAAPETAS